MEGLKRKRMEKLIRECQRIESGKGELYTLLSKLRPDSEWLRYAARSIPHGKVRRLRDRAEALAELADHERNQKMADPVSYRFCSDRSCWRHSSTEDRIASRMALTFSSFSSGVPVTVEGSGMLQ